MAKPRDISGLTAELPYAEAAARVVEVRAAELGDNSSGVLDIGEIERLHDMRVASRRLRAALEVFAPCFPRPEHRAALREVKTIADALGDRRDRDVAIEAMEGFAAAIPAPDRPGIRSLIESLREQQRVANEALAPFVEPARIRELERMLEKLVAAARQTAAASGNGALP